MRKIQNRRRKLHRHRKAWEQEVIEIVVIEQENLSGGCWSFGKITEKVRSNDELTRSTKLLMQIKHMWHSPLNKIYPLTVSSTTEFPRSGDKSSDENSTTQIGERLTQSQHHSRAAKMKAKYVIREGTKLINDDETSHSSPIVHIIISVLIVSALMHHSAAHLSLVCQVDSMKITTAEKELELCIQPRCRFLSNPMK